VQFTEQQKQFLVDLFVAFKGNGDRYALGVGIARVTGMEYFSLQMRDLLLVTQRLSGSALPAQTQEAAERFVSNLERMTLIPADNSDLGTHLT
jgi:hypothetical protein